MLNFKIAFPPLASSGLRRPYLRPLINRIIVVVIITLLYVLSCYLPLTGFDLLPYSNIGCSYNLECMHVCDGDNVPGHLASYLPLHGNKMIGGVQDSSSHLLESTGLSSTSTSTKGEDAAVVEEDSGMTDSVSPPASLLQTSGAEPRGVGAFGMSESMSSSGSRRKLLSIREGEGKILLTMEEGACCPLCNDGFCEAGKRLADQTCVSEKIFEQLMMKEKPKGKVLPPNIIVHLID